jgi:hypothetical protein
LEKAQDRIIETHVIKVILRLLKPDRLSDHHYQLLLRWMALYLTRNQKARSIFYQSAGNFEKSFRRNSTGSYLVC